MKYIFSAQFLKVQPPDSTFADAWESLCHDLLRLECPGEECLRLLPPDRGVDVLLRKKGQAIEADERLRRSQLKRQTLGGITRDKGGMLRHTIVIQVNK
jgi:hypothetical protein